jgi:hypothetical protein
VSGFQFRRKANRLCVWFSDYGLVPVASALDGKLEFLTNPPQRIGDDVLILVEGQERRARLLHSDMMCKNCTYLVDQGPAHD